MNDGTRSITFFKAKPWGQLWGNKGQKPFFENKTMKKLLFVAGILLASSFSFAQNAPVALPKQFVVRAPIAPIDGSFEDYKSYSVKLN